MLSKTTQCAIALVLLIGALPAGAAHRAAEPRDPKLARLAWELEGATRSLVAGAAEPRGRSRHALHALHQLEREARELRAAVERDGGFGRGTRRELRELEQAFERAEVRLPELRPSRHTRRDFQRVAGLVDRLGDRLAVARDDDRRNDRRGAERHAEVRWPFER